MLNKILSIKAKVLNDIVPKESERKKIDEIATTVVSIIKEIIQTKHYQDIISVELEGSYAKDTWLSGEVDLDIFLLFDTSVKVQELKEIGLEIGRATSLLLDSYPIEQYATHPYIQFFYKGIKIEIVPAYKVPSTDLILTSVDRTPFHTKYVKEKIKKNPLIKNDIRILKKFMKGIGVYGAEIKVSGFSGYLTELLIIRYGSFENLLEKSSRWKPWRIVIDPANHYNNINEALKRFNSPLIIIDPVDKNRNAAAAVSAQKISEFIVACKSFLKNPLLTYFYPRETPLDYSYIKKEISQRNLVLLEIKRPKNIKEEVLWGQLKRITRSLIKILKSFSANVLDYTIWISDSLIIILLELEQIYFPPLVKHLGPPIYSDNLIDFLEKYNMDKNVVGPYVEGTRVVVLRKPRYSNVIDIIRDNINKIKISQDLSSAFNHVNIAVKDKIALYCNKEDFCRFLQKWLMRKFSWIT